MRLETLERLLNERILAELENRLILISTCDNIEYTKVWYWDNPESRTLHCYAFIYFIKNDNGDYVGAVETMDSGDLFVFVKKCYRRKGIAFSALDNYILPHLCSTNDSDIRCRFISEEGKALGKKLSFKIQGNNGVLRFGDVKPYQAFIDYKPVSLKNEIEKAVSKVQILKDKMLYAGRKQDYDDLGKALRYLEEIKLLDPIEHP